MGHYSYSTALMTDSAKSIVRIVESVRTRFADGIRQMIGVTHFVSKNLTHDYDHLQAGFAYLVESELMRERGVAVIETEEARAIAEELRLSNAELESRGCTANRER